MRCLYLCLSILFILKYSDALNCYTCCGCNGERSSACSAYGASLYGLFGTAINFPGVGQSRQCENYLGYNTCAEIIMYDTTNNQPMTIKQCMTQYSCEGMRRETGKNIPLYYFAPGVNVDVRSVKCCAFDMCNDHSAATHLSLMNRLLLLLLFLPFISSS